MEASGALARRKRNEGHSDVGAGDGNRTHVTSLEGWSSAIELHPQGSWGACRGIAAIRHRVGRQNASGFLGADRLASRQVER